MLQPDPNKKKPLPFDNSDDLLKKNKSHLFQPGNKLWEKRETDGRAKVIENAQKFWELFLEYVKDVDDNPWVKNDVRGKDADKVTIELQRPYTWNGFDNYVFGKELLTNLDDYKHNTGGAYGEFVDVVKRVDKYIYDQKFTGAVVGEFNASIISKELGLVEKKEVAQTVSKVKVGFAKKDSDDGNGGV